MSGLTGSVFHGLRWVQRRLRAIGMCSLSYYGYTTVINFRIIVIRCYSRHRNWITFCRWCQPIWSCASSVKPSKRVKCVMVCYTYKHIFYLIRPKFVWPRGTFVSKSYKRVYFSGAAVLRTVRNDANHAPDAGLK